MKTILMLTAFLFTFGQANAQHVQSGSSSVQTVCDQIIMIDDIDLIDEDCKDLKQNNAQRNPANKNELQPDRLHTAKKN